MADQEHEFTPEQNLAYIRNIIEKSKPNATAAGVFLFIWGGLGSIVTVVQYLAVAGYIPIEYTPIFWILFTLIGTGLTIYKGRQLEKIEEISVIENITKNIFLGSGISIFIFFAATFTVFLMGTVNYFGAEIFYVISIVMANAFFTASFTTGIKWFRIVALGWWVAVAIFVIKPFPDSSLLLLIAALDFILLALPGWVLMVQNKTTRS